MESMAATVGSMRPYHAVPECPINGDDTFAVDVTSLLPRSEGPGVPLLSASWR